MMSASTAERFLDKHVRNIQPPTQVEASLEDWLSSVGTAPFRGSQSNKVGQPQAQSASPAPRGRKNEKQASFATLRSASASKASFEFPPSPEADEREPQSKRQQSSPKLPPPRGAGASSASSPRAGHVSSQRMNSAQTFDTLASPVRQARSASARPAGTAVGSRESERQTLSVSPRPTLPVGMPTSRSVYSTSSRQQSSSKLPPPRGAGASSASSQRVGHTKTASSQRMNSAQTFDTLASPVRQARSASARPAGTAVG